jgi:hypothetical protein
MSRRRVPHTVQMRHIAGTAQAVPPCRDDDACGPRARGGTQVNAVAAVLENGFSYARFSVVVGALVVFRMFSLLCRLLFKVVLGGPLGP